MSNPTLSAATRAAAQEDRVVTAWENRCPECGTDVARVLPCPICRGRCCPCFHADDEVDQ